MTNRKMAIIFVLLCLCFHLMPHQALSVSTSDAAEPIMPEKECSLTISYCHADTAFSDLEVKLYKIAEVSADFQYTLTQPFEASGLILNGIQTVGEWNVVRSTLEAYILANHITPEFTAATNEDGQVTFGTLMTGMYLATVGQAEQENLQCRFDSALIALPGLGNDGMWQYQVSVNAKGEVLPPVEPDDETFKVLKLWRGDENQNDRPKSIEVEIFCNGISYKTATLSEDNHWAYTWSAKNDGSNWTVVERNIPQGYTMTVEERQATFVLTNTRNSTDPDDPPKTGDTMNILLYVLVMVGSGSLLIILGMIGKKKRL